MPIRARLVGGLMVSLLIICIAIISIVNLVIQPRTDEFESYLYERNLSNIDFQLTQDRTYVVSLADQILDALRRDSAGVNDLDEMPVAFFDMILLVDEDFNIVNSQSSLYFQEKMQQGEVLYWLQELKTQVDGLDHLGLPMGATYQTSGIAVTPEEPMMLAIGRLRPKAGTVAYVLVGRFVHDSLLSQFSGADSGSLAFEVVPTRFSWHESHTSDSEVTYSVREPLWYTPDLQLQIDFSRERVLHKRNLRDMMYILFTVIGVGVVVVVVLFIYLQRILISPILRMKTQVERFARGEQIFFRNTLRKDELGVLEQAFNRMARTLIQNQQELKWERNRYRDASLTDALTGLRNRRYLEHRLSSKAAWDSASWLLFMMLDIDLFKHVNDTYGHDVGDRVLKALGDKLKEVGREQDILVRNGGEEFAVVAHIKDPSDAEKIVHRLDENLRPVLTFDDLDPPLQVTCSYGVYIAHICTIAEPTEQWPEMLKAADLCLYAAKNSGRDGWIILIKPNADVDNISHPYTEIDIRDGLDRGVFELCSKVHKDSVVWSEREED